MKFIFIIVLFSVFMACNEKSAKIEGFPDKAGDDNTIFSDSDDIETPDTALEIEDSFAESVKDNEPDDFFESSADMEESDTAVNETANDIEQESSHDSDADSDNYYFICEEGDTRLGATSCGTNGVLEQKCKNNRWLDGINCSDQFVSSEITLRRIGHRDVFISGNTDAPVERNSYLSLASIGKGQIAISSRWETPQVFQLHPESGILEEIAFIKEHHGNEDSSRYKIRAHKSEDEDRFLLWQVSSYENIDGDPANGNDGVALSARVPSAIAEEFLEDTTLHSTNLIKGGSGTNNGIAYDQENRLFFVSTGGAKNPEKDDVFQIFRLNTETNRFEGRIQIWELEDPANSKERLTTFIDLDPKRRVMIFGSGKWWDSGAFKLGLAEYTPGTEKAATVKNMQIIKGSDLSPSEDSTTVSDRLQMARGAVFATYGEHLFALVAGGVNKADQFNYENYSFGIYLFDLGKIGESYKLSRSVAVIPHNNPIEGIKISDGKVFISSYGIHVFDLEKILESEGKTELKPKLSYPLYYKTFEFDIDQYDGKKYLFLSSGTEGVDVFEFSEDLGMINDSIDEKEEIVTLGAIDGKIRLRSGGGLKHMGVPSSNENGDIALWAVTDRNKEVIVLKKAGEKAEIVAMAKDRYISFGPPSVNRDGDLAFFAGRIDGKEEILIYEGGMLVVAVENNSSVRRIGTPEISDYGDIVFSKVPIDADRKLIYRKKGGELTTIIQAVEKQRGSKYKHSFYEYYDISPEGNVLYVKHTLYIDNDPDETHLWKKADGSDEIHYKSVANGGDARRHFLPRIGKSDTISIRSMVGEIAGVVTIKDKVVKTVARHRKTPEFPIYWTNFGNVSSISNENTVFIGILRPEDKTGNVLHFYDNSSNEWHTLLGGGDTVAGKTVKNIRFKDSYSEKGVVHFNASVKDETGKMSHLIMETTTPGN